jgi:hypothetical protein
VPPTASFVISPPPISAPTLVALPAPAPAPTVVVAAAVPVAAIPVPPVAVAPMLAPPALAPPTLAAPCGVGRSVTEDCRREPRAGQHRQHGRERLALGAHRKLEVTAAGAQLQMPPQRTTAKLTAMGHGELFANVLTGCAQRVAVGDQGAARLVDERLDPAHRTPHDRGDCLVGKIVELGQQQRAALVLG